MVVFYNVYCTLRSEGYGENDLPALMSLRVSTLYPTCFLLGGNSGGGKTQFLAKLQVLGDGRYLLAEDRPEPVVLTTQQAASQLLLGSSWMMP